MSDYPAQENPELPSENPSLEVHPRIPTPRPSETVVNSRQMIARMQARPGGCRAFRH